MADKEEKDKKKKQSSNNSSNTASTSKDKVTGKPDKIEFEPTTDDAVNVNEQRNKAAVFAWGRMNPPTEGHEKLVKKVEQTAKKANATPLVFLTQSQDPKKNPLDYNEKLRFAQKAFGSVIQRSPRIKTLIQLAQQLEKEGYTSITMVAGADRLPEFQRLLTKYNGQEYNFESIDVVSAGERDPDADDVSGMSASKMRMLAAAGNFEMFKKGLPSKLKSQAQKVYDAVRNGMRIIEQLEEEGLLYEEGLTVAQRLRKRQMMRRNKMKVAIGRRKASRRRATQKTHQKRAKRSAISAVKQRFAGGKSLKDLSPAEKKRLESIVGKRKNIVNRIATRLVRVSRARERERFSPKREDINSKFSTFAQQLNEQVDTNDPTLLFHAFDEAWNIVHEELHQEQLNEKFEQKFLNEAKKYGWRVLNVPENDWVRYTLYGPGPGARFKAGKPIDFTSEKDAKAYVLNSKTDDFLQVVAPEDVPRKLKMGVNESFESFLVERRTQCAIISKKELQELERFADRLLEKFGIDIEFTKHFGERMSDSRNNPCIEIEELRDIFKRIASRQARGIKKHPDTQVVLKHMQRDLNMPVVIDLDKKGEFEVRFKTIMRKKNFTTPNKVVAV